MTIPPLTAYVAGNEFFAPELFRDSDSLKIAHFTAFCNSKFPFGHFADKIQKGVKEIIAHTFNLWYTDAIQHKAQGYSTDFSRKGGIYGNIC